MSTRRGLTPSEPLDLTPLTDALLRYPEYRDLLPIGAAIDQALRWNA